LQAESRASARLFTDADLEAARFIRERTPPHALFLTAPDFNQPALCLAGRPVLRGPTAWLWGHGYEFRAREADVRRIYAGAPEAFDLLKYYGVDYVYFSGAERDALRAGAAFFDVNFPAVYRGDGFTIYDVRRAGDAANAPPDIHPLARVTRPRELSSRVGRDPFALLEEFEETSFSVYRMWKAARGRAPTRDEFMPALQLLGSGVYVGEPGWRRRLEENRREFAVRLAEGDSALAAKLLAAATDPNYDAREYDAAYVLVHFFGYLGRDPGAPPDRDLSGYDFWLEVLSRTGDRRALSRAFMESDEYKNRSQ
jgi:hypothetical protein